MPNTAARLNESAVYQEAAEVLRLEGQGVVLRSAGGVYRARRAVGCLVAPEAGDRVLAAVSARDAWVLTVLDREGAAPVRLTAEGDMEVSLPAGRLSVTAAEGVDVASGALVSVVAGALRVAAGDGELSVKTAALFAGAVDVGAETVRLAAGALDQTLDRLTQRVKRAYRYVEEFEQVRAGRLDYAAHRLLELRGATATVTAETLVRVDAEQVHIG